MEMVAAVGGMAEAAVGVLDWSHQRRVAKAVAKEWEFAEVEGELDLERKENMRLRATIAMYQQAFGQLHQQKMENGTLYGGGVLVFLPCAHLFLRVSFL